MNIFFKLLAYLLSVPGRLKGMKFGKNSFIGPGYDWLFVDLRGVELGDNVPIGKNAWFQTLDRLGKKAKIIIGNNTNIGRNLTASAIDKITIGNGCLISYNVSIFDHEHKIHDADISPINNDLVDAKEIIIEDDCFIGAHTFILKGVHLGKHCVVAANSVVTKSFPPFSVIAGNPATLIRKLK